MAVVVRNILMMRFFGEATKCKVTPSTNFCVSPSPPVALTETCVASTTIDENPPGRVRPDGSELGQVTVEEPSE